MIEQKPGIHPSVYNKKANFQNEEWKLLEKLAKEWYVTNAGEVNIAQSHYKYALIKATVLYREMFGFERELIVVFSDYKIFQARSIDAIDTIYNLVLANYQSLRVERICSVLISKDIEIERKIRKILTESKESQVIVPISYDEFLTNQDSHFLRNKFKSSFYDRDLFDISSPLRKDLYFFGRTDLINKLGDRHFSNENSGVFGLRRSGKTSLIYAVERQMERVASPSIYIPCDDTSFQQRRWNECLYYVLKQLVDKYKTNNRLKGILSSREFYSEKDAQAIFKKDLLAIYEQLGKKPILLIFDEIERITFNTAFLEHWQKGLDFILFWGSLKSTFNTLNGVFSYMIVGTNPTCIEAPKIQEYDNPIFQSVSVDYLERFDVDQTRDMVEQLGKFLGVTFDDVIYGKLVEDYGGHPFLIRQVCSLMYQANKTEIPIKVDRPMYQRAKYDFAQDKGIKYMNMILAVLTEFYKDEYTMLTYLALGDVDFFNTLAKDSPEYVAHLVGYGIISRNHDRTGYDFRIDAIQQHLESRNRYKKLSLTLDEKRQEISQRRNDIELKLRDVIRIGILGHYKKVEDAKTTVWNYLKHDSKNKKINLDKLSYKELFNPSKVNIFFDCLKKIVLKEWEIFEEIFKDDTKFKNYTKFQEHMEAVNKYRYVDAHAGNVSEGQFTDFRTNIEWLETCLLEWEKLAG
jgi:hypothetical protein